CFQASAGALGCSSCHDPHRLPAAEEKVAYYAGRCVSCHQNRGCSLPLAARQERGDDCAACHMPRLASSDIIHVAATDHRILRDPTHEAPRRAQGPPREDAPLVPFHPERRRPAAESDRDLGMALAELASKIPEGRFRKGVTRLALPLLEEVKRTAPDDL